MTLSPKTFPRLGLGCVTFGREIDRAVAFSMMDHALRHGLSLFDTAAAYGGGASEDIVGRWIAERGTRDQLMLATKILPPYSPAAIEASFAGSLRRLQQPDVDLLYLHRWDEAVANPEVLRALDGLVRSGRVRMLGASNFSAAQLEQALRVQTELGLNRFRALQVIHNFAVRGVDAAVQSLCAHADIAIVGYSPLGAGFLTGKHSAGVEPGSRFDIIPGHQNVYFNDLARHRLAQLERVSSESKIPIVTLALAWALQPSGVATVLVGGRSASHLDQALNALRFSAPEVLGRLNEE